MLTWMQKSVAVVCVISVVMFAAPKQSEAILLAILGPVTLGGVVAVVVADLAILCAVGLICGGGGGGGGPLQQGGTCRAENYCGMSATGIVDSNRFCNASPPPNSECTSFPFPDDALIIDPKVFRINDQASVIWNIGEENYPPNCTLSGPQIGTIMLTTETGSEDVIALGPQVYTLTCGTEAARAQINILPVRFET